MQMLNSESTVSPWIPKHTTGLYNFCLHDTKPHSLLWSLTHGCADYETDVYLCSNKKNSENWLKWFIINNHFTTVQLHNSLIHPSRIWELGEISPQVSVAGWRPACLVDGILISASFLFQSCGFNFTFTFSIDILLPWRCIHLSPGQQIIKMPELLCQQFLSTLKLSPPRVYWPWPTLLKKSW